jgi:hypothetical protein
MAALILFPLLLTCALHVVAAGLEASLDRQRVVVGETVLLTLTAPGDSWGIPDLGPLAPDFEVENRSQSTKMTIVNGQASSTREWRLLLAPTRTGTLSIPALQIGDLASEPIEIEVLPVSEGRETVGAPPVMVEVEVDKPAPFVQEQVIYTTRVLSRVQVHQATLEEPEAEGVILERVGEDRSYQTHRKGQRYSVIERRYALFPQRSGPVRITPPSLSGGIAESARGRAGGESPSGTGASAFERLFGRDPFADMGSLFQPTRPIRVRGSEIVLEVRPQPQGSPTPWLPAQSLQLADTFTPHDSRVRVGEPVTRTIAITAQGLTAAQLPDLRPEVPDGVKLYPDKGRTETRAEGEGLVAVREIRHALVPSAEGELVLPEVRLPWWDAREGRERVAALPARVLQVLPARGGAAAPSARGSVPAPAAEGTEAEQPQAPTHGPGQGAGATADGNPLQEFPMPAGYWPWLAAGLGLLWLLTLLAWLRERVRGGRAPSAGQARRVREPAPDRAAARTRLRRACEAGDARAARDALLAWAAACWPQEPPMRLESLAARFEGPAAEALQRLDRSLYAPVPRGWDGRAAWALLRPALARAETPGSGTRGEASPLPALYPEGV